MEQRTEYIEDTKIITLSVSTLQQLHFDGQHWPSRIQTIWMTRFTQFNFIDCENETSANIAKGSVSYFQIGIQQTWFLG